MSESKCGVQSMCGVRDGCEHMYIAVVFANPLMCVDSSATWKEQCVI